MMVICTLARQSCSREKWDKLPNTHTDQLCTKAGEGQNIEPNH